MTISNESFLVEYTAQGIASEKFPVTYVFFAQTELFVYHGATEATAALQTLGTNYSVGGGDGGLGTIIWNGTPTAGGYVGILRRAPATQVADYQENDPFPGEAHEDALDQQALAQQAALRRSSTDPRHFDAQDSKIQAVTPGAATGEVVTYDQLQAATLTPGSLPTILAGDVGQFLQATDDSPQLAAWETPLPYMPASPGAGDVGEVLTVTGAGATAFQPLPAPSGATFPFNFITNGQFVVSQRAGDLGTHTAASTYPNSDGAYVLDRWILLSEVANTVEVTHENTVVPAGARRSLRATVTAAGAGQKFGFFTVIESALVRRLLANGTTSRLSFRFSHRTTTGAQIRNIRVAVLPWTGAADAITRDAVSVWGAEGTTPTFIAAWNAAENTVANIPVTLDAWGEDVEQNILMDTASTNNVGLFIWVDDKDTVAGDILYLGDVQLEIGALANSIIPVDPSLERLRCQRYFQTSYPETVAPGTAATTNGTTIFWAPTSMDSGDNVTTERLFTIMRIAPGVTIYNSVTGGSGSIRNTSDGDNPTAVAALIGTASFAVQTTVAAALDDGDQGQWLWVADSEL